MKKFTSHASKKVGGPKVFTRNVHGQCVRYEPNRVGTRDTCASGCRGITVITIEQTTSKHVLVVDDEPDFAALLRSIIEKAGYTVVTVHTCDDGLAEVHKHRPDIITLDIHMPRKSSVFFYRKLVEDQACHDIPVVVVTSVTRDSEMEKLVKRLLEVQEMPRPRAYIEKPIDGSHLLETLKNALMPRTLAIH